MLISSSPLRFSLNGGGSDLPSYLESNNGLSVAMPINKRVYITLHGSFSGNYRIAYSKIEEAESIEEIQHPIVRATLELLKWSGPGLEITSIADVPSHGTGLGSSSAFTVALISGILNLQNRELSNFEIAKLACEVELEVLESPIGYQDQYGCAMGDINEMRFYKGGIVEVVPLFSKIEDKLLFTQKINNSLLFFHINQPRSANKILGEQQLKIRKDPNAAFTTSKMVDLAEETITCIKKMDIPALGSLLTSGWKLKSSINGDDSDIYLSEIFDWCESSPIYGAKLLGAGGGGFLAVLAEKKYHQTLVESLKNKCNKYDAKVEISGPNIQVIGESI